MTAPPPPDPDVDAVLAAVTLPERLAVLSAAGPVGAAGLARLLDAAEELAAGDPRRGRLLAEVCAAAAEDEAAELVPRARYLQAQASARDGSLEEALQLIEQARRGWAERGEQLLALRTTLGKMHVLDALGRYDDALANGRAVLAELNDIGDPRDGAAIELRAVLHQNLGAGSGRRGDWLGLIEQSREAQALFERLGAAPRVAALDENVGIALVHLGRVDEALETFDRAVTVFRDSDPLAHARCLIEVGRARLLRGEYASALTVFDEAAALLAPRGPLPDQDWLAVSRADAHLALGLADAALDGYGSAVSAFRAAGLAYDLALALTGRGAALVQADRAGEAEETLTEAGDLWASAGNGPMLSVVLVELADLRARAGDAVAALAAARDALAALNGARWPVEEFHARLRLADLLLPDLPAAEEQLQAAAGLDEALVLPQLRHRLDERLGALRLRQGRADEGVPLLERAAATVDALRGALPREAMRASFLRDRTGAHTALLEHWLDQGDPASLARAFELAERVKSRALVDLMRGSVSARLADAGDDPATARLRALQADLDAVYSSLLAGDGDREESTGARGGRAAVLRARAEELERRIDRIRLAVPVTPPRAALDPPRGDVLPALRTRLPGAVPMLAYHVLGDEVLAFVEAGGRLSVVRGVTTASHVELLLARLAAQWSRFRAGPGLARRHADRLAETTRRVLAALHDALLRPVAPLLPPPPDVGVARLVVVPHGALHRVPFHALHDGARYVVEHTEVSYAPSATALSLLRPPDRPDGPALVLGVPDPDIPAVREEVAAVAAALPGAAVHLDEAATTAALRAGAPGARVVHLACHGLFRPDNPMFSALRLHDRWLTAADALELELPGALVTLSACESGAGRATGGGDEVLGLPRAFLGAGAAAVLVSLWLAEDGPTAALMGEVYRGLRAGLPGPTALRAAQLALATDHPHPHDWAPFVHIGAPTTLQEDPP